MEILVLKSEEMMEVIDMKEAIEANKLALKAYSSGKADIPLRINLDVKKHNGQSLYMPGYLPEEKALGVKLVSVYPDNVAKGLTAVPSLMVLVDDETGIPNSIMDGTYLTQLRTGAVSGAATDLLARKDSKVFTLIGAGGQALAQLEAVLAIRDIERVYVQSLNLDSCKSFVEKAKSELEDKYDVEILVCEDLEKAIRNSDIITSVTTAKNATFKGEWVQPGTHINGVGSYTPEMAEIPEELILKADKIYCDTKDAIVESGDFVQVIEKGVFKEGDILGELGELILENIPGRENEEEITFFNTTGNGVLDIMVAKRIYDLAVKKGIGEKINM